MYGMMYGVKRTTIYLPDELKAALERTAEAEGRTEADIVREAIVDALQKRVPPAPRIPVYEPGLGDPHIAERVDELLAEGFGR
jgi:hypothetical protein